MTGGGDDSRIRIYVQMRCPSRRQLEFSSESEKIPVTQCATHDGPSVPCGGPPELWRLALLVNEANPSTAVLYRRSCGGKIRVQSSQIRESSFMITGGWAPSSSSGDDVSSILEI